VWEHVIQAEKGFRAQDSGHWVLPRKFREASCIATLKTLALPLHEVGVFSTLGRLISTIRRIVGVEVKWARSLIDLQANRLYTERSFLAVGTVLGLNEHSRVMKVRVISSRRFDWRRAMDRNGVSFQKGEPQIVNWSGDTAQVVMMSRNAAKCNKLVLKAARRVLCWNSRFVALRRWPRARSFYPGLEIITDDICLLKWLYRQAKCHASWCYTNSVLRSRDCEKYLYLIAKCRLWFNLLDGNENHMLMLINCWVLDHVRIFFKIKPFVDLSAFALKS